MLRDLNERHIGEKKSKKPIDENSATHIIRNALGGVSGGINKQYEKLIDTLKVGLEKKHCLNMRLFEHFGRDQWVILNRNF